MPSGDESDVNIDHYLSQAVKKLEVDRVLACLKIDPFAILELPYAKPDQKAIKVAYRKKSLMIHPDKVEHEKAEEAFAMLKKAESDFADEKRVAYLLGVLDEAKYGVVKDAGFKIKTASVQLKDEDENGTQSIAVITEDEYPVLRGDSGKRKVQEMFKKILVDDEVRRRRLLKVEQRQEADLAEKAEKARKENKRKAQEAKQWEATRDTRVSSWRDFQKKGSKKAKTKKSGQ